MNLKQIFRIFHIALISVALSTTIHAADKTSLRTVVIDAGHGGKDPGTTYGKSYEKNFNLDIALALGSLIEENCPDVEVIYTRKKDTFLGLAERSRVASKNNADLFISIHVDAVDMRYRKTSPSGHTVYILSTEVPEGKSDMYKSMQDVCKRENSVIMFEDDYKVKYKDIDVENPDASSIINSNQAYSIMLQSLEFASYVNSALAKGPIKNSKGIGQGRLQVLWNTGVPSVLIEVGYMTHPGDRAILLEHANRVKIAECIYKAFVSYKKEYDKALGGAAGMAAIRPEVKPDPTPKPAPTSASEVKPTTKPEKTPVTEANPTPKPEKTPTTKAEPAPMPQITPESQLQPTPEPKPETTYYATQIFVLSRKLEAGDPALKGCEVRVLEKGGRYEYLAGCAQTLAEAREKHTKIVEKFPGTYLVKVENGTKTRVN